MNQLAGKPRPSCAASRSTWALGFRRSSRSSSWPTSPVLAVNPGSPGQAPSVNTRRRVAAVREPAAQARRRRAGRRGRGVTSERGRGGRVGDRRPGQRQRDLRPAPLCSGTWPGAEPGQNFELMTKALSTPGPGPGPEDRRARGLDPGGSRLHAVTACGLAPPVPMTITQIAWSGPIWSPRCVRHREPRLGPVERVDGKPPPPHDTLVREKTEFRMIGAETSVTGSASS